VLFSELPGLQRIRTTLIQSVKNNHIAHAQLFLGTPGSGNLALALAYATYINCENKVEDDACGVCPSCSKYNKLIHPDLHFAFPVTTTKNVAKDPLSNLLMKEWRSFVLQNPYGDINNWTNFIGSENKQPNISVEESRNIIKSLVLKSFEAEYKVLILWLPEFMNPSAANAILKILEEPPYKTIFLLVSNNSEKLLTTILSRTQLVNVPPFTDEEICKGLINTHKVEEKQAKRLAYLADGNFNEALRLMKETEEDNHQIFRDWMRSCFKKNNLVELVNWSEQFHALGKEAQKNLITYGLNILREALIFKYHGGKLLRLQDEDLKFIEGFSKILDNEKIERISKELNKAHYHLERNANAKILFLDISLYISSVLKNP